MYRGILSTASDVQVHHSLTTELVGGPSAKLTALAIGDHPLVQVRIIHHKYNLSLVHLPHIMALVIQGHRPAPAPPPAHPEGLELRRHTRPPPKLRLPGRVVRPAGVRQAGIELHPALPLAV